MQQGKQFRVFHAAKNAFAILPQVPGTVQQLHDQICGLFQISSKVGSFKLDYFSRMQHLLWKIRRVVKLQAHNYLPAQQKLLSNQQVGGKSNQVKMLEFEAQRFTAKVTTTPSKNILYKAGEYNLHTAIAELVDNSIENTFDNADDRNISINFEKKEQVCLFSCSYVLANYNNRQWLRYGCGAAEELGHYG